MLSAVASAFVVVARAKWLPVVTAASEQTAGIAAGRLDLVVVEASDGMSAVSVDGLPADRTVLRTTCRRD